jgi:hypothetical protein
MVLPIRDRAPARARGFTHLEFFRSFDREPWTAGGEIIVLART